VKENSKAKKALRMVTYSAGYMLGGGGQQITSMYYLNFLIFGAGLSPAAAGFVSGIAKVWDGLIDPFLGLLVDRTKTRWGACRPYLLFCALPVFVSYYLLWNGFGIASQAGKFLFYLFACIFFSTASSLGTVPYEALLPRMVESYTERTHYSVLRSLFAGMASAGSVWLFDLLVPAKEAADYAGLGSDFKRMGLVLGAVFAIAPLVTFAGSRERTKIYDDTHLTPRALFSEYTSLLRCRLYRKTFALNLLGVFTAYCSTATQVLFILLVYSNRSYTFFGIPMRLASLSINWEGAWEVLSFLTSIYLLSRFKKKQAPLALNFPLHIVGSALGLIITSKTPLWFYFLTQALSGYGASCIQFIPTTLLADLPDVDEVITGKEREGVSAGFVNMGKQVMQGLAFLLCGGVLSAFGLNESNASPELAQGAPLFAVKLLFSGIPTVCGICMWLFAQRYPLSPEIHAMLKMRVAEKRRTGNAACTAEEKTALEALTGLTYSALWIGTEEEDHEALSQKE
jgi:Na+/melibiose symporter-like transporter